MSVDRIQETIEQLFGFLIVPNTIEIEHLFDKNDPDISNKCLYYSFWVFCAGCW